MQTALDVSAAQTDAATWTRLFLAYMQTERRVSPHTVDSYQRTLRRFFSVRPGDVFIVKRDAIRSYLAAQLETGLSPKTANAHLSCLRTFFHFISAETGTHLNPCRGVRNVKGGGTVVRPVAAAEIDAVLAALPTDGAFALRNRAIVLTLYGSALRISDLLNLRVDDPELLHGEQMLIRQGKGQKDRLVPVNEKEAAAIREYIEKGRPKLVVRDSDPGWLFLNSRGGKLSRMGAFAALKKLSKAVIGRGVSAHKFRHAACTEAIRNGMDIRVAQEMMGHSNVNTTMRYTHTDLEYLRAIYLKTHPRGVEHA